MPGITERTYAEAVEGLTEEMLSDPQAGWFDYVTSLPKPQQVVYMVLVFHNQVFNGGFHQYFANCYGQFAPETIISLNEIGALEKAGLLEDALALVNYDNLSADAFRQALLKGEISGLYETNELFDSLDSLDDKYYDSGDDVEVLLEKYLAGQQP